jgi:hypothetical protein
MAAKSSSHFPILLENIPEIPLGQAAAFALT